MTGTKSSRQKRVSKIPKAPPAPSTLIGLVYPPKKSQAANYPHWNRFPYVRLDQAIMLMLGIEPGTKIRERLNQQRFHNLYELAESCRSAGTLPYCVHDPDMIRSLDAKEWADSMGEALPTQWQPVTEPRSPSKRQSESVDCKRNAEAHTAIVKLYEECGRKPKIKEVLDRLRQEPSNYPYSRDVSVSTLRKSISRGGDSPLKNPKLSQ